MTETVTFVPNTTGIHALTASPVGPVGAFMLRLINDAVNYAKQGSPVDTGYMRSRVEGKVEEGAEGIGGELAARTDYAVYVNRGTRYMRARPFLYEAARKAVTEHTISI